MLVVEQVNEMGSHRRVVELLRLALRDVEVRVIVPRLDCRRSATMLNIDVVLTSSAFVLLMIDDSTPLVVIIRSMTLDPTSSHYRGAATRLALDSRFSLTHSIHRRCRLDG